MHHTDRVYGATARCRVAKLGRSNPMRLPYCLVLQEVPELSTRAVVIIHHTDCGGQAVMQHHDMLVGRMMQLTTEWNWLVGTVQNMFSAVACTFIPRFIRKKVLNAVMRPFSNPVDSVKEDVWILRNSPLMPQSIPIYGLVGGYAVAVN
eukprot:GHUV01041192.1.p2 GENE.GHUV01041192.1~~GHUV01041192.1.p2  ORF type:complete len:149 (+),score=22.53 GHUV01041192.1:935-1381(+)